MKNSDIALVILIAAMSFGLAYWIVGATLGKKMDKVVKIDYIQDISSTIEEPDHETFNAYASNLNEEIASGRCEYGMVWDGLRCVEKGKENENKEGEGSEGQNPEENPSTEE